MINIVYMDVYFCFNFLMDFFVLYVMRLTLKERNLWVRDTLAAFLGSTYATIILNIGKGGVFQALFTYLVIPVVMMAITSKQKNIRELFKRIVILYFFVFIVSGVINAIYYGSLTGKTLLENALQMQIGTINLWMVVTVIVIGLSIIKTFVNLMRSNLKLRNNLYEVLVVIGDNNIKGKGLLDTGNQLVEPITGKSVFIIEQDIIKHIDKTSLKPLFIPYNSVGKEHGLMEGVVGDFIEIEGNRVEKPIIGIHKGKLSQENKYNMILPPNI